jgi:hypothetical protein
MERCTVCRARLNDGPLCRRCGSDFSLVLAAQARMHALFSESLCLWQQGHAATALALAGQAVMLKTEPVLLAWRDYLIDHQLHQALSLLEQGEIHQTHRLCQQILAVHPAPLALALRRFIDDFATQAAGQAIKQTT